jgi:hypothetical protein
MLFYVLSSESAKDSWKGTVKSEVLDVVLFSVLFTR